MSSGMSILMVIRFLLVSYLHYFPSKQAALMILERGNNCIEIKNEKGTGFFYGSTDVFPELNYSVKCPPNAEIVDLCWLCSNYLYFA